MEDTTTEDDVEIEISTRPIALFGIVFLTLFLVWSTVEMVPDGHVRTVSTFGEVQDQELRPGLNFVLPIVQTTRQYSFQSQTYTMTGGNSDGQLNDDAIQALTQEGLNINMDISVRYHLRAENASDLHKDVGTMRQALQKVIRPTIRSGVRSSTSEYSVNSIYSDKRDELAVTIKEKINKDFEEKGFVVEAVQIRNVMLPKKVRNAIQEKEAAQQMIETKQNQIQVEEMEKKRKIVEAQAIAESNRIIGNSLSKQYLMWYWVQNLDSHNSVMYVPVGNGGMPVFKNVDSVPKSGNFSGFSDLNMSMPMPNGTAQ